MCEREEGKAKGNTTGDSDKSLPLVENFQYWFYSLYLLRSKRNEQSEAHNLYNLESTKYDMGDSVLRNLWDN